MVVYCFFLTDDNTDGLVSGNEGELGDELALVDVEIGTANTASLEIVQVRYVNLQWTRPRGKGLLIDVP